MLGNIKIESDWLKVEKIFNEKYKNSDEYGCATDTKASVLLRTILDDNLRLMGQSREITNRIQKLRKSTGISIDDQIEVFYQLNNPGDRTSFSNEVIELHSDKIAKNIKMPFHPVERMPPQAQPPERHLITRDLSAVGYPQHFVDPSVCCSSPRCAPGLVRPLPPMRSPPRVLFSVSLRLPRPRNPARELLALHRISYYLPACRRWNAVSIATFCRTCLL